MELIGTVSSRSSRKPGGPPSETEILRLNPQRRILLCKETGWNCVEPGSLNVDINEPILQACLDCRRWDVFEPCDSVYYPPPFSHIPTLRQGYRYFRCTAVHAGIEADALVRRAVTPLRGRVELFAPAKLREVLALQDGDSISILLADTGPGTMDAAP